MKYVKQISYYNDPDGADGDKQSKKFWLYCFFQYNPIFRLSLQSQFQLLHRKKATFAPKILMSRTRLPRSTMGEEIRKENVTPKGSPAFVKPIKSGMEEQEQNGVTVPNSAEMIFPLMP